MKIFCWVKHIIKRFIYEKTIRPFNTSDYYGSAMGRGKREIRRSASPQWTLFGREIYWGASVFWITHWKHWFGITSLQQQRPLALVVKRKIMQWVGVWTLEPHCWCLNSVTCCGLLGKSLDPLLLDSTSLGWA